MALIKCPECGHMISEYADKCISCGCPMTKIKELIMKKSGKKAKHNKALKPKKVIKPEPQSEIKFLEGISTFSVQVINILEYELKRSINSLYSSESVFDYKLKINVSGHEISIVRFYLEDKRLNACTYSIEDNKLTKHEYNNFSEFNLIKIRTLAVEYAKQMKEKYQNENQPSLDNISKATNEEDNDVNDVSKIRLYQLIANIMNKKPLTDVDWATKKLAKDVAKFAFEIYNSTGKKVSFYVVGGHFFGHAIHFNNVSPDEAKLFYRYFKANKLVEEIRKQEKLFNLEIINNYKEVMDSFAELILEKPIIYSKASGINSSNWALVPESKLDEIVEYYEKLEK